MNAKSSYRSAQGIKAKPAKQKLVASPKMLGEAKGEKISSKFSLLSSISFEE